MPLLRCDNIVVSSRGIAETHGRKVVAFVPSGEIEGITLKYGRSDHRPAVSMSIGIILALAGVFGLVEFCMAPRGFRYELGLVAMGIIGGSIIFDSLKERYFLEVQRKSGMCRMVFSKGCSRGDIESFCNDVRSRYGHKITNAVG